MISKETIEAFSYIAFERGPFFFSLLFMLVIVGVAHKCYRKVNLRTDPVASAEEKRCYKIYFVTSFSAGLLLVFISVGWWMYANIAKHTLRGTIIGLVEDLTLVPVNDDIYMRNYERNINGIRLKDLHFAMVRDSPFSPGQRISFEIYPKSGFESGSRSRPAPEKVFLVYSGSDYERLQLVRNGSGYSLIQCE